jgi:NAD(P)-dependent dehydrogenase (short-subunit alcohol dehydrogenase family)
MDVLSRFRLDEKVAIVTGGGRGNGKATALHFAHVGAHVVVAEIDKSAAEAVTQEIQVLGRKGLPVVTDVTNSKQASKLVETTMKAFGRIDILVNNVGRANPLAPVVNISDEEWDQYIRLNLTGTFFCSRAVSKVMLAQKEGNIINISSAMGARAAPGKAPYSAAKAGVINFTQTLSIELARYHIRVNCIIPGAIDTMANRTGTAQERLERTGIPLGRIGKPEDVALAAIYLASSASDFVTGACIVVNGGPYTRKGDTEMFITHFPEL